MFSINISDSQFSPKKIVIIYRAVGFLILVATSFLVIPTSILDTFMTLYFPISIIILAIAGVYVVKVKLPNDKFPLILFYITTLYFITFNIYSSRMILGKAYAGDVIQALGNYIVMGDSITGLVKFAFIIIFNLALFFTFMFIAKTKLTKTGKQSPYTIATHKILMTFIGIYILLLMINMAGGLMIGILQRGMSLLDTLQTYSPLIIGDGLIQGFSALFLSISYLVFNLRKMKAAN